MPMSVFARWINISLISLALAAVLGVLMRFIFLQEVPGLEYRYAMHAHSHGAMLGWVFPVLYTGYVYLVRPTGAHARWYNGLFWLNVVAVAGMFVAFTIQGYGAASISFTTLHLLISYVAVALLWPDLRRALAGQQALPWLLAALASLVLATGGIWALAVAVSSARPNMELYYLAIQFFLHWQLNGWFLFATLGLVLALLERRLPALLLRRELRRGFWLLAVGTPLTYGLAVAWAERHPAVYVVTGVGVALQLVAIGLWLRAVWPALRVLVTPLAPLPRLLWIGGLGSVAFKALVHGAVAIPYVAHMAFTVRNYVIGFVHVVTLGATTLTVLALLHAHGNLSLRRRSWWGAALLLLGFVLTEALLFLQGTMFWLEWSFLPRYYLILFIGSVPLLIGAVLLIGTVKGAPQIAASLDAPRDKPVAAAA